MINKNEIINTSNEELKGIETSSLESKKNGLRAGNQSYKCKNCGYQYVENPISKRYPVEVKQLCLKM